MPSCLKCNAKTKRRRKDRSRWCSQCGCQPSGRHLDTAGRPTTYEERWARARPVLDDPAAQYAFRVIIPAMEQSR